MGSRYRYVKDDEHVDHEMDNALSILWRWMVHSTFALVYFAMSPQVGNNGEMTAATFNFTSKG